jgi:hypothetical protein
MNRIRIALIVLIFFLIIPIAYTQTSNPQPGSPDDPLITKGYVDEQMTKQIATRTEQIRTDLNQMIAANVTQSVQQELEKQTKELVRQQLEQQIPEQVSKVFNEKANYQLITVPPGQTIRFGEGTEVVVRSGRVTVFSPDRNGISDLSDGKDLAPKSTIVKNHLLLFPRDGRGLTVSSAQKTAAAMIVRGSYILDSPQPEATQKSEASTGPSPTTISNATATTNTANTASPTISPAPAASNNSTDLLQ